MIIFATMKRIITKSARAQEIMKRDEELLRELDPYGPVVLHFYEWERPSATFGYFTDPARFLDMGLVERFSLDLARRPTGGGILFHLSDWAFSLLIPSKHRFFSLNTLENYALVNGMVRDALEGRPTYLLDQENSYTHPACNSFCMAKPTKYDIMMEGKKVGGAAQRRSERGLLHQGTVSIAPLERSYLNLLLFPDVAVAMQECSAFLTLEQTRVTSIREELKNSLIKTLEERL